MFIKPFAFADFVEKSWPLWKFQALNTAKGTILEKLEDEDAGYAYAGNQTKIPVLWGKDDYKFLSQFPPKLWGRALSWRYNEGLLEAAKLREKNPENSLDDISDTRDQLVFEEDAGRKYVFSNVWTGLKSLIERMEKPIKYHAEHNPPGVETGTPGLKDIDPWETDENHPRHPSKYKHGLMDYDITNPVEVTDEYIDSIPDNEINIDPSTPQDQRPAAIAKARAAMKKSRHHTFSGMTVLKRGPVVSRMIASWLRAQGLGLLGSVPQQIEDPITGQLTPVILDKPSNINGQWRDHVGEENGGIPLAVPTIKRRLNMKVYNSKGEEIPYGDVAMPVLNPTKLLPRIVNFTPEQREKIAKRRGFDPANSDPKKGCPGVNYSGMSWQELESVCINAKRAGSPQDVYTFLKNFDILNQEQIEHVKKNQRDVLHLAYSRFGNRTASCAACKGTRKTADGNICPECGGTGKDTWSQPTNHYVLGWQPNKAGREIVPSDMKPEDLARAVEKYYNELYAEASKGIDNFIRYARGNENRERLLPDDVLDMVQNTHDNLASVCAALLGLNLNHPNMGIRDPAVGLTNVPLSAKDKIYILNSTDKDKIIKALMKQELPENMSHMFNQAATGQAARTLDYGTAQQIADILLANNNPEGNWPEKIVNLPITWVMKALTRRRLAKATTSAQSEQEENEDGEEVSEEAVSQMSAEDRSHIRMNYAFNFARDFSQAAFGGLGSRKFREKFGKSVVSLNTPSQKTGDNELGDLLNTSSQVAPSEELSNWWTRRSTTNPKGDVVSRLSWNVPEIGHNIDKFFQTIRKRIQKSLGEGFTKVVDQAQERIKTEIETMKELTEKAKTDLKSQNPQMSDEELAVAAKQQALQQLPDTLKQKRADLYGDMTDDDVMTLMTRHGAVASAVPEEMRDEHNEYMEDFIKRVIQGEPQALPRWDKDQNEFTFDDAHPWTLANFKNAKAFDIIQFFRLTWSEDAAKKWAVPLLLAVSQQQGKELTQQQATDEVIEAGVVPDQADQVTQPTPVKIPQIAQPAQPAIAATDLTSILANLPQNYQQIDGSNKEHLKANKETITQALIQLRQKMLQKRKINPQLVTQAERDANIHLTALLKSLEQQEVA